jgi:PAS domain S-box-containing protein
MVSGAYLLLATGVYLMILFGVAYFAERRKKLGSSIVSNPLVYSLSLAVYCTSWTFYGSVGKASTYGLSFLAIYIGPTLMAVLWRPMLSNVIRIARENRITTIADFLASRYGNCLPLAVLVTVVATVGIIPYLGLQVKAIISTFFILSGAEEGSVAAGWVVTVMIGLFAVIFGVRPRSASEKHEGLVFAIAFESIVKLFAFIAVGLFVTYGLFGGHVHIFEKAREAGLERLLTLGMENSPSFTEWGALIFLSMMAVMFLPRQFHMAVVENHDTDHVKRASWMFPLYLFLINIFVLPVALAGILLGGDVAFADFFVLTIPMQWGKPALAYIVFIGGFSAASGMIIVESLAISNMVMNTIVTTVLYRYNQSRAFPLVIANIKRIVIWGLILAGYLFGISVGGFYSLVDMGLKSFEAVSIFAPAFFFGLYWKRGNKKGAIAGVSAGFLIWCYTLLVPMLMRTGLIESKGIIGYVLNSRLLNPHALFGLTGLDQWTHSLFWGMFFNILLYIGVSLFTKQDAEEERQALIFVERLSPVVGSAAATVDEIEDILVQFVGEDEARKIVDGFITSRSADRDAVSSVDMIMLREEARRALSGMMGSSIASMVLRERLPHTEQEHEELLRSVKEVGKSLRLSRQELASANRELALLKEFSENIIESLPLGVVTIDERQRVQYWNEGMERISGIDKESALGEPAEIVLQCLSPNLFYPEIKEGNISCNRGDRSLEGHVTKLTGQYPGYVLLLEDVTEKKKIEEELLTASKHASIGRLSAGVSHEIGNPLAAISSLVQELLAEEPLPETRQSLDTALSHVNRIARIVRDLGDFARMTPREKTFADVGQALEKTLSLVRYDKNFRNIAITTDMDMTPKMRVDPDRLQQVFLNLILNARDSMPDGGDLDIKLKMKKGFVEFRFKDSGGGIAREVADKIFDPFFTTKRPAKGTGLGLSVSYSIIKDHGGTIEYEPWTENKRKRGQKRGKQSGSVFIIRLPIDTGSK